MRVKQLQVAGLRAFEHAQFDFEPGMNLLVGVNGVGKSTVLDSLRICLSKILPDITGSQSRPLSFLTEDINTKVRALTVNCTFEFYRQDFSFLVHKQRESRIPYREGVVRQQTLETPDRVECTPPLSTIGPKVKDSETQPLGLFFSTRRSLVSDTVPRRGTAVGGIAGAFADALTSRELRLVEAAYWMRAQEELATERPIARKHLEAMQRAAKRFLPECKHLRAEGAPRPRLLVEKHGSTLDVRQLSDGERGLLALVLDLTRRLSQANPVVLDPANKAEAVVLIDELDLHLHPKWQRTIVERLTRTFPRCQFVATTHSPQIVSAVEPEQVLLLSATGVVRPDRSLGMDSNWILRHLMEADERPIGASRALRQVENLIKSGNFKKARATIIVHQNAGLDLPEWAVLEARMARMELLAK